MKRFFSAALFAFLMVNLYAQTIQDAQREIDNESYFKAKQILFKLAADPNANAQEVYYYLGNAYLKTEDADSAKVFYKLAYNPDSKTAINYLANGRMLLLTKNKAEAKLNFDRALQITKMKNANIYYEIGDAYFQPNVIDLSLAISHFESAFNLDNKNTTVMLALGDAYLENAQNDNTMGGKAMNKYEAASEVNNRLPLAWIKIGRLAVRGRIYDQAIDAFKKALAIDPNYAIVYKELAEAYYLSRQYDQVQPNFEKYLALSPGDKQARTTLASLIFQSKDYDKAIEESNKGLKNDPDNFVFYRIISFSNYELKRYKDAHEASKKFWDNPNKKVKDIDYVYSAKIAAAVGDTTAAFEFFKTVLENCNGSCCDLMGDYGKVLFTAKHYEEAIAQYVAKKEKCGTLTSLDVYYLGRSYYSAGDSLMADTTFAEFVARNPTSPDGYLWRAKTNLKMGKPEDFMAFPYYQKYVEVAGKEPQKYKSNLVEAYIYMGVYYFEKDKAMAKENLMKALELDPNDTYAQEFLKQLN
ncbi:MAG: tetratricopeptide repeat protein [Chitinophagales bacterium]|nr:tetratricopeptide repeat protein [Chitinophagales bacterium]